MANCQNNVRPMRQGNMMQQRPSCRCGMEPVLRPEPRRSMPECERREVDCLQSLPIAMAYVPWQRWRNIYDVSKGFRRGTIFEELDKPFLGRGGCNR